jgi:hypothetical protein
MTRRSNRLAWLWTVMTAAQRTEAMRLEDMVQRASRRKCNPRTRLWIAERVFTGHPLSAEGLASTIST